MTTCHQAGGEAAVALLTRRPVPADVAAHLDSCPTCGPEWERLGGLADLLAAAREVDAEQAPAAGPDLLERLLVEAARSRRRRRVGLAAACAAAVVLIAGSAELALRADDAGRPASGPGASAAPGPATSGPGSTGPGSTGPGSTGPGSTGQPPGSAVLAAGSATASGTGVWAQVEVRATAGGSDVAVSARGLTPGSVCQVVVVDRVGHRETAGSWTVSGEYPPGTPVHETVHTAPRQIAGVELIDEASGHRLLAVPIA